MPMPTQGVDMAAEYRRYFADLKTEETKIGLLKLLKERRDRHGDAECGKLLLELGQKWMIEKWIG
jgi:hypothetical protein